MKRENEIEYSERLVAFIDILGFSQIISSDFSNDIDYIKFFNKNLSHVVKILKEEYGKVFSIKMFSDCICLSCEPDPEKLEYILSELSFIQLYFSTDNIFIRGGFAKGKHFENENLIYSKGLIRAYELEKTSIYPRILISDDVVELIKKEGINQRNDGKFDFLMKSPDGLYFLDYLDYLHSDYIEADDFLKSHKASIINQVRKNKHNNRIVEKYKWLSLYHNIKFGELFNREDYYEDAYHGMQESLCIDMGQVFPSFKK